MMATLFVEPEIEIAAFFILFFLPSAVSHRKSLKENSAHNLTAYLQVQSYIHTPAPSPLLAQACGFLGSLCAFLKNKLDSIAPEK